jgi:hypothetical protein
MQRGDYVAALKNINNLLFKDKNKTKLKPDELEVC